MPVTAKFSEEFYARLGHRVADELVDWFNRVDESYRNEFRELYQVQFARLEATVGQALEGMRADMARLETRLIRWMFLFWVANLGTTITLIKLWNG